MNCPRRDPLPSSPPVDFPLYGLEPSWPGPRWLELFGEAIGDPVSWVTLGHRSLDGESTVFVETFSRPRADALVSASGEPPMQHVAHYASNTLINVTLPEHSAPLPDGFLRTLGDHAYEHSLQYAQWPLVRWRVDGTVVTARAWRFAGGWVAISDGVESVYLAAVGVGTDPDGLSLAVLQDDGAYHFDLNQPLHPEMLSASLDRDGGYDRRYLRREEFHADQLHLLRDQR
jgi:hypothetical protein